MYQNRTNPFVIRRMIERGRTSFKSQLQVQIVNIQKSITQLNTQVESQCPDNDLCHYLHIKSLQKRIHRYSSRLLRLQQDLEQSHDVFTHRVGNLSISTTQTMDNQQSIERLVLVERLLQKPCEMFHVDPSMCKQCNVTYLFDSVTSVFTCPKCGKCQHVLFLHTDQSQDLLVEKQPVTKNTQTKNTTSRASNYTRSPLYRRYLSQFAEGGISIPTKVMKALYQYLSMIHLQTSVRCRPTPVAALLRSNGFSEWAPYAVIITKQFNGEPIPILSQTIIDRLVERFEVIFQACTRNVVKQKIPSFELLTHILLFLDGHLKLAMGFSLHKSRDVVKKTITQIRNLLPILHSKSPAGMTWTNLSEL